MGGLTRVDPARFAPLATNRPGQPLDRARLESDIQTLYGLSDFKKINYNLNPLLDPGPSGDRDRLLIRLPQSPGDPVTSASDSLLPGISKATTATACGRPIAAPGSIGSGVNG